MDPTDFGNGVHPELISPFLIEIRYFVLTSESSECKRTRRRPRVSLHPAEGRDPVCDRDLVFDYGVLEISKKCLQALK